MKKDKQKWINEIENGLDHVTQSAQPDAAFMEHLVEKLHRPRLGQSRVSPLVLLSIAASLALLIGTNFWVYTQSIQSNDISQTSSDEYQDYMKVNGIYPQSFGQSY